jgi:hypothetical protein
MVGLIMAVYDQQILDRYEATKKAHPGITWIYHVQSVAALLGIRNSRAEKVIRNSIKEIAD